jgi:5-methylcytosine-specific restriction enzyme A
MRKRQLEGEPLCAWCLREGRITPATVAHHEILHKDDPALFWNSPLVSLCKMHHDSDAQAIEKGGKPKRRIAVDGWPIGD